eukprot:192058-Lingulodinium_polyedra.AAC.1
MRSTFAAPRGNATSNTLNVARVIKSSFGRATTSLTYLSASNSGTLTQTRAVRTSSLHVSATSTAWWVNCAQ